MSFLLASVARPETIATRFATVKLIQTTIQGFVYELWTMSYQVKSIGDQLHKIRRVYEAHETKNKVPDGVISFPEDRRSLASGVTVEFQYVPFLPNRFKWLMRFRSFTCSETSLSVTPKKMSLRSVMCHSKSRRANFALVSFLTSRISADS